MTVRLKREGILFFSILFYIVMPINKVEAGSCCGGGSSSSLVLPKFAKLGVSLSLTNEHYDGYWTNNSSYLIDPPDSSLNQYRMTVGYAHRVANDWQLSITTPYIVNDNRYTGIKSFSQGIGDTNVSAFYELFSKVQCIWKVRKWQDLLPATYIGLDTLLPTGLSPYSNVIDSFSVTGRGLYRVSPKILFDKTVYPWSFSFSSSYGYHFQRPVNQEYGNYIVPYDIRLGNRFNYSILVGYTHFFDSMAFTTLSASYAYLNEEKALIDDVLNDTTGLSRHSGNIVLLYATTNRSYIFKLTYNFSLREKNWGRNTPLTDTFSMEVNYVLR